MGSAEFKFGDRLVHESKPEWGAGVVTAAQTIEEGGKAFQRLTLRFDRAGLKTISTAHARLKRVESEKDMPQAEGAPAAAAANGATGWLGALESGNLNEVMSRLPESTRDPFVSLSERLKATLGLYRFSTQGASLLDWAAMQTGLTDPLTRFNRHELEEFFKRFAFEREARLKLLAQEVRKNPPPDLQAVIASAPPAGRDALKKLYPSR